MQHAVEHVPKSEHHCTPVAVKATAGLRLLGKHQSDAILTEVRQWLEAEWPFTMGGKDAVAIMDGKDEGVYAWITINYLLGLIGPSAKDGETAAVMDLGGASTQIVFEPSFPSDDLTLSPGDHVYELTLPSGKHTLYQHSHLGYGLMQARRSVHNLIAFTYIWQSAPKGVALEWEDLNESIEIPTPCLVKGGKKVVELDPPGRRAVKVTFVGTGAGFEACRRVVDVVMAKDALCEVEPCAFGGVYQPQLMQTFGSGPIYACVFELPGF
jgi:guanosine-diphosphatase